MIITLDGTTSSKISAALLRARRTAGSPAQGMVLTLIIVCDESEYAECPGGQHGGRSGASVPDPAGRHRRRAEGLTGRRGAHRRGTPGEVVVIRMRGAVAAHPASVIRPLLLPDSPVVIWWPGKAPNNRAADELAQLAMRRLTDAASAARPLAALKARARDYTPGDTDLSWTRLTPWRALLAAALDQYPAKIKSAAVEAERGNPSADLLAAWLQCPAEGRGDTQDQQRPRHHRGADDHRCRRHRDHPAGRPAGLLRRARPARAAGRPEAPGPHRADLRGTAPDGRRRRLRAHG